VCACFTSKIYEKPSFYTARTSRHNIKSTGKGVLNVVMYFTLFMEVTHLVMLKFSHTNYKQVDYMNDEYTSIFVFVIFSFATV
jgi:uncharacterized protein YhhL (DUF1145 family)